MFDTQEVFLVPFRVLKVLGVCQEKTSSWPYRVYGFLLHFIVGFLFELFGFLYLFHFENLQEFSDCISIVLTVFACGIKILNFIYNFGNILLLIEKLNDLVTLSECNTNESHKKIKKQVDKVKFVFKMFASSAFISSVVSRYKFSPRFQLE